MQIRLSQWCSVLVLLALLLSSALVSRPRVRESGTASSSPRPTVILDAGHGGEDGGAVGVNGVREKELNLAVTECLAELLTLAGVEVILTRTDDRMLYTAEQNIPGKRKYYDLVNRLAVAEAHPDALFVSIHMNHFSEAQYSGLQVWCAEDAASHALAEAVSASVKLRLQRENARQVKEAGSSILLLSRAVGCAVLVECGFLSNPSECALLCREDYRRELSFSIFCGIMEYLSEME